MRVFLAICALVFLAACGGGGAPTPISVDQMEAVAFRGGGAPKITVITMVNNRTGKGGHTAILINGSQRVLFDPAGTFRHSKIFRHDDVLYGITDAKLHTYRSAHARATHHVVSQSFDVSAQTAEQAIALAQARGEVPSAFCTNSSSTLLQKLPGFSDVNVVFYPHHLMAQLAGKPGVVTERYYEDDVGDLARGVAGLEEG